jgi:ATP adenylyltransferase
LQPLSETANNSSKQQPKADPFAEPEPDLLIAEIPQHDPTHFLVLNKFPVIPNHFILATKLNKPQTDLLEKRDLAATYACLKAWESESASSSDADGHETAGERPERRLFAFFNSGVHSGASQPHRHLQFLPVEDTVQPDDRFGWAPLIDRPLSGGIAASHDPDGPVPLDLPFVCYVQTLVQAPTADDLHRTYISLYRAAVAAAADSSAGESSMVNGEHASSNRTEGPAEISYNLAMTTSRMMICPRVREIAPISLDESLRRGLVNEGSVSLNGTILAGTLMVKAESEWSALRNRPTMLEGILQTVGVPRHVVSSPRM